MIKVNLVEDVGEDLKRFREEFRHPKYKRLKPLVALGKISEFDFNIDSSEPRSTRFLEFQKETTAYEETYRETLHKITQV